MNKMGYESIDDIRERGIRPLSTRAFKAAWEGEDALLLDARHEDEFAKGFIPGAINIGLDGNFAMWVGALITDLKQPILFVCEKGREEETVTRLARVGYDHTIGYLDGGFEAWKQAGEDVETIPAVDAVQLAKLVKEENVNILDVRKESEYDAEHIVGAQNFPLDFINRNMEQVDREKTYYLHCKGGYRSMTAASILKARGFEHLVNVTGGFDALKEAGVDLPFSEFQEQVTEL
jgi:Rhodanese-related sulfurtransferase